MRISWVLAGLSVSFAAASVRPVNARAEEPAPRGTVYRVAAVGDSLTDVKVGGGLYLEYLSERCPKSQFDAFGKGGEMVNQMRKRFVRDLWDGTRPPYTHVIVFGGVNDLYSDLTAGRTVKKIERDLGAMYAAAREHGAKVVAIDVAPWGGFKKYFTDLRAETTHELNAWILAQPKAGTVDSAVDAHALLSCGDAEVLCPAFAKPHKDGLHFGPEGHRKLAAALADAVFSDCL
ncbi:MAG TPA: SGNH/GDSL hydrolase family protein [Polyangiaceae bacterium]|nr:SGNH/GDSL hydrolase family protein [Polyangiaceae bacterium]